MHVAARAETVAFQVENGVCDELARAVEGRLAAAQGFVEFGAGCGEVGFLRGGDGAYFATTAGVDRVELGG